MIGVVYIYIYIYIRKGVRLVRVCVHGCEWFQPQMRKIK